MFQDEESLTKEQIEAEIKKIKEAYADDQGIYLLSYLLEIWTKCGRRGRIKEPVGTH
ncbi:hypothetical protein BHM03_00027868, partial [Ensete ventricosum]